MIGLIAVASGLASAAFVVWGLLMVTAEDAPALVIAVGVATVVYGALSAGILAAAWRRPRFPAKRLATGLAVSIVAIWLLSSLDYGSLSPLEGAGVTLIGVMVCVNWCAIQVAARPRLTPHLSGPA